jgi:hypothetical protein
VIPPKAIKVVATIIRINSLPFKRIESLDMPASKAPVKFRIATNPPIKSIKIIISATWIIPFKGAKINGIKPWGLASNFWYVSWILIAL